MILEKNKIIQILNDIEKYQGNTLEANIKKRLDDVLNNYLVELNFSTHSLLDLTMNKENLKELIKK